MSEMTNSNKDKLMNDLRLVMADAEELLRMTADQAGDSAGEIRARIQAKISQAKADLALLQESAVAKAKAAGRATDEYVHENPWKAIGIAAGAGLVIGLLIGRR